MVTAEELNKLVNDITNVGYKVTNLLNQHMDAGDITEEQAQALRTAGAFLASANSVVWEQYLPLKP